MVLTFSLPHPHDSQLQQSFKTETLKVQQLSERAQTLQQQQARVQTQVAETEMVKKELDSVEDGFAVYKLSGPALIKQELPDAQMTIDSRLKYLTGERDRVEKEIEAVQKETIASRTVIEGILKQYGELQAESAKAAQQAQAQPQAPAKGKGKK